MGFRIKLTTLNGAPVLPELDCAPTMGVREMAFAAMCLAGRLFRGTMAPDLTVLPVSYDHFNDSIQVWGIHKVPVKVLHELSESMRLMEEKLAFKMVVPYGSGQFATLDSQMRGGS